MCCLLFFIFFTISQDDVIAFFPQEQNERFTIEIRDERTDRKFKVIAESLRKSFGLNLIVEDSADVIIKGNFSNVTVNEFLTYVAKNYELEWFRIGEILHFKKPNPPAYTISVVVQAPAELCSIDATDVPLSILARELTTKTGLNFLAHPQVKQNISGLVQNLPVKDAVTALITPYQLVLRPRGEVLEFTEKTQLEREAEAEAAKQALAKSKTAPEPPPLADLSFENDLFTGRLRSPSLQKAVEGVVSLAGKSTKFLDPLEGGQIDYRMEDLDFDQALTKLFIGTPFSFKQIGGIYLLGVKTRPELTASEMIILKHINAQNALAYLSGETGLLQTFNLPSRPSTLGSGVGYGARQNSSFGNNSFGNYGGQNRLGTGLGNDTLSDDTRLENNRMTPRALNQPIQNQPIQNLQSKVTFNEQANADITLVREHNALIVTATQDVIQEVRDRLALIDRPIPQVLIQALVVDFQNTNNDSYGIDITNGGNNIFPELDISLEGTRNADGSIQIGRLPSNFGLRIQALAEAGKARILSKPHIATLSGHEAYIEVGLTNHILLESNILVGDENPVTQTTQRIETVEANISLRVIPWVTASGEITTYIEPIFNNFLGTVENNVPPPVSTRRLQSTVRLKNGQTIILGGLIEESLRNNTRGIPGISRLPILGFLFKNRNRTFQQSELVIYLTPYVYHGDEGSVTIIKEKEGIDYPLDVQEQKELIIKGKKHKRWRRKNH